MVINYSFNKGPKVEILGGDNETYLTEMFEYVNGIYNAVSSFSQNRNTYIQHNRQWYTDWYIKIFAWNEIDGLHMIDKHRFDATDKNVRINIDADNIVDANIWLNYAIDFKNKHCCNVYINCKFVDYFDTIINKNGIYKYSNNDVVFYATYDIGKYDLYKYGQEMWGSLNHYYGNIKEGNRIYKSFKNPVDWNNIPTGQVASDILGLKYKSEYENIELNKFGNDMISTYNSTVKTDPVVLVPEYANTYNINFINGAFFEILGKDNRKYTVEFIDGDTGDILHKSDITNNMWTRTHIKYHVNWIIKLYTDGKLIYTTKYDPFGKNVYISLESSSLGDTLAWMPYVNEYSKKYSCNVICSTFMNSFFEKTYPNIKFIKPGDTAYNIYAQFGIGIFGDGDRPSDRNVSDTRKIPLQKVAAEILHLEFSEIKPEIYIPEITKYQKSLIPNKEYVVIAQHGTAQTKYWNNETGWQKTVDYLISKGYDVLSISKEGSNLKGVTVVKPGDITNIMHLIKNAKFMIGIGSGLSWLSWAIGTTSILISGFSKPFCEYSSNCYRIHKDNVCNGCWHEFVFDKGDWNWCPKHKGTDRMFECSKKIEFEDVKVAIDDIIGLPNDYVPQY